MAAISEKPFEFLGTIAGRQAYTSYKDGRTYSRILDDIGASSVQELRERISPDGWTTSADHFLEIGKEYSYWGKGGPSLPGGGFFKTVETYDDKDRRRLNSEQYALEKIGKPLEDLVKKPMADILFECATYGIRYFVDRYFDPVERPEEGDLVIYFDDGKIVHSGIFRNSAPNWNSPRGGTVESKWYRGDGGNPYSFQHDVFFIPKHFGDTAQFLRLKTDCAARKSLAKHDTSQGPMYIQGEDGAFRYVSSASNDEIRRTIDNTRHWDWRSIEERFPQIECIPSSPFCGLCYAYAFWLIYKGKERPFRLEPHLVSSLKSEILETHFSITHEPKPGDLAVYTKRDGRREHFGVYIDEDLIESKWGSSNIYRHPPFYVDTDSGDIITYYRPN